MKSASSESFVSIDFPTFASCCDTFSHLLWPSNTSKSVLSHIHHVAVFPPPEFLCSHILTLLIRLSRFCEPSQSSISLALAAELVVLASSNSLETAHHKMFLFGPASAMQIRLGKGCVQDKGSLSSSLVCRRRLQESMAVISELLISLNLAPLQFSAQVCLKDTSEHGRVLDTILSMKSNSNRVLSLPLEVYVEVVSSFRQQVQLALSGNVTPSPLFLDDDNDSVPLQLNQENDFVCNELSVTVSLHHPNLEQNEAFSSPSAPAADQNPSKPDALDFKIVTSSILRKIVAQVASRFESSRIDAAHNCRRILEPVCSKIIESIVFHASQKYLQYTSSSIPAASYADCDIGPCHHTNSTSASSDDAENNKSTSVQSGPIYGRHPSYRVQVPEVEVISFEQVNPVWTHQCKPGSRICVLLRCHQRLSSITGKD
jgi:hypothetical protein